MRPQLSRFARARRFESLEIRLNLSGDGLVDGGAHCDADALGLNGPRAAATAAVNCLAFDLYANFNAEEGNLLLSPLSISTALAMTAVGANNVTADEMNQVLHLGNDPSIHASFNSLLNRLDRDSEGENARTLEVANALWPHLDLNVEDGFLDEIAENYRGYAQRLDYFDPDSYAVINQWAEEQTNGRIQEVIPKPLPPTTRMVLTNSVYFDAQWKYKFDSAVTQTFTLENGERVQSSQMPFYFEEVIKHKLIDGHQVAVFPYEDGKTSMVVLLPATTDYRIPYSKEFPITEDVGMDDLTTKTLVEVNRWLDSSPWSVEAIRGVLPKFQATVSSNLNEVLEGMGMPTAFHPTKADFSNMTDTKVHISNVRHKAFIDVNEVGTEAAAVTVVEQGFLCLAKGTPIQTRDGVKLIEDIVVGDFVLSRSDQNVDGQIKPKRVEELFRGHRAVVDLHVGDQVIRCSSDHRFFVRDRGWIAANELLSGDELAADVKSWKSVDKVVDDGIVEDVYNFRVAAYHTYFIGDDDWGFTVWTHNCYGCDEIPFNANRPFHYFIRDDETSSILFMGRVMDPTAEENSIAPEAVHVPTSATNPDPAVPDPNEPTDPVEQPDPPAPIAGDANGDQLVNFADFLIVSDNFGKTTDEAFAAGDFNEDGIVSFADFLILSDNFEVV